VRNATYRNHGTHAEAIEIIFDPAVIGYREILEFFFRSTIQARATARQRCRNKLSLGDLLHQRRTEADRRGYDRGCRCFRAVAGQGRDRTGAGRRFLAGRAEHQDYLERYPAGYTCHFVRPGWKLPVRQAAARKQA